MSAVVAIADADGRRVQGRQASVSSSLTAQNTFTDNLTVRGNFNVSISGTWAGTLTLYRAYDNALTPSLVVNTYTANIEDRGFEPEAGVVYKIGFATGDYTSGTAVVRISQ